MKISVLCLKLYFLCLWVFPVNAQDSLSTYNFEMLSDKINATDNIDLRFLYIDEFIEKAKRENNLLNLKAGFYYRFNYSENDSIKLQSLDSIIKISEKNPDPVFTSISYISKASLYREKRDFKKALNTFLKANKYAKKHDDKYCFFQSNLQIGILKDRIGNYNEALKIHKENINFVKKNSDVISQKDYLSSVFALAFTYKNLRQLDSAGYYNDYGLEKSKNNNFNDLYHHFLLNKGIIQFSKKEFLEAEINLHDAKDFFKEQENLPNTAEAHFYLGKIKFELKNKNKGVFHLKRVDSIFNIMNDLIPEIRETYYILSEYYEKKKDIGNQLRYTQKLIRADSILNSNYIYINENLKYKYDIPKYTAVKEELIKSLENKNKSIYYYSLLALFLASSIIIYLIVRQVILKKRFNLLIKNESVKDKKEIENTFDSQELDIPEEILNNIIRSIKNFEADNKFIDSKITLTSLAKDFNTNTTYLSRAINHLKNKNINVYLNELRIDFAIEKIKTDSKFRKYTIKAIAKEVGFKSSETFSKTFLKKTGLKPSYFIKQVVKSNEFSK